MSTDTSRVDSVLDALGNPTRREILALLREKPLAVGAIAERLPISRPAVSKHLRLLQEAGLVAHRADGARNVFCLRPLGFRTASLYLGQFWDTALDNFEQLADRANRTEP